MYIIGGPNLNVDCCVECLEAFRCYPAVTKALARVAHAHTTYVQIIPKQARDIHHARQNVVIKVSLNPSRLKTFIFSSLNGIL